MQYLQDKQIAVPARANSWLMHTENAGEHSSLVLRLGGSEFLIEDQWDGISAQNLLAETARLTNVFPVARADAAFIISGSAALNLWSELCAIDLRDGALLAGDVVMTQVAGISAVLLRQTLNGEPVYRLWCDGTYGADMWQTLLKIAEELGGGAVGLSSYQH